MELLTQQGNIFIIALLNYLIFNVEGYSALATIIMLVMFQKLLGKDRVVQVVIKLPYT